VIEMGNVRPGNRSLFRAHRCGDLLTRWMVLVVLAGGLIVSAPIPSRAAFPGADGLIAFSRHGRIWVTDTRGNDTKLTRGNDPAWSADGTRIAFDRYNRGTHNSHIWTMLADGSQRTRMTSGRGYNTEPAWSPDGSELVFVRFGDLFRIDSSISSAPFAPWIAITNNRGDEHHPSWSPDGSTIAFDRLTCGRVCGTRIGAVAPDGGSYRMLTPLASDVHDLFPDWSPDSTALVFESDRNGIAPLYPDVYRMSASGDGVVRLTSGGQHTGAPAWAPDGTKIVYVHISHTGRISLRIGSSSGGSSTYLTRAGMYEGFPDWQPLP
jgi:TolB protein